jgi:hypothetical protein
MRLPRRQNPNRPELALFIWALLLLLASLGHTATIGIENKNPGNIIAANPGKWGAIGRDAWGHLVFGSNEDGLGAIRSNLKAYRRKGICTVGSIVRRWVPYNPKSVQNRNYLFKVKQRSGFEENEKLDMNSERTLFQVTRGIVYGENGYDPYTEKEYAAVFGARNVSKLEARHD